MGKGSTYQAKNVNSGRIVQSLMQKDSSGELLEKKVQVIPTRTKEIKDRMQQLGKTGDYDVVINEIGGTVGDIEALP